MAARGILAGLTQAFAIVLVSGCGRTTTTGTERHVEVGSGGASDGGSRNEAGGEVATGGGRGPGNGGATSDPCAGVRCASPRCPPGSAPVTRSGECCPTSCAPPLADAGTSTRADGGSGLPEGGPSADGGRDATGVTADGGPVDCARSTTCPSASCQIECCPGSQECAPCCVPRSCTGFDAAHCPLDRCQLLPTCEGTSVCYGFFTAPPPPCGGLGYYGGHSKCCPGVVLRCGLPVSDGSCDLTVGGYDGFPMCIACGDGTCDSSYENRCNCPEDCP